MLEKDNKIGIKKIIEELKAEEETENQLIWLYQTLLGLGIENCFSGDNSEIFKDGMERLHRESVGHKALIGGIISKYEKI